MSPVELGLAFLIASALGISLYRSFSPRPGVKWSKWAARRNFVTGRRRIGMTRYLEGTFDGRHASVQHALPLVGRGHPCEIRCTASVPDFRVHVERRAVIQQPDDAATDEPPRFIWVYSADEDLPRSAGMERLNAMVGAPDVQAQFRALTPDYFGVADGEITASWESSPDGVHAMDQRLDAALALAVALEQADGAAWNGFAEKHGFVFTQESTGWLLVREDDHSTHRIHHHPGHPSKTRLQTTPRRPTDWPAGLQIQPLQDGVERTPTGNPILDQFVDIQCADPHVIRQMGAADLTPAILTVVQAHGGCLIDGQIVVECPDLLVDPTEVLMDMETLAQALRVAMESD